MPLLGPSQRRCADRRIDRAVHPHAAKGRTGTPCVRPHPDVLRDFLATLWLLVESPACPDRPKSSPPGVPNRLRRVELALKVP